MLESLRRLTPYIYRYRATYALGAVCVVLAVALRFCVPYLLGDTIDVLRTADQREAGDDLHELVLLGAIGIVGAAAVGAVIRVASRLWILGNSRRAVHDLRSDMFAHLVTLAPSFYVRHRIGQIMSRCVNDMQNVQGLLGPVFMYLIETAVLYLVGGAFLVAANPTLAWIGLLPFPFFLFMAHRLARKVQAGTRLAQERLGNISAKVDESLAGQRVIKSLAIEGYDFREFERVARKYAETQIAVGRMRASLTALMTFLAAFCTLIVLMVGGPLVADGQLTIGSLVAVVMYFGMLAVPTRTLGFVLSSLQRGAAALGRIGELLDTESTLPDRGTKQLEGMGGVRVHELTVRFADEDGRERTVLDRVSFDVAPGSTMAIVGPVGSGKSTLLGAIARQVEVPAGTVFHDGEDIVDVPIEALRRHVGMAPQEAFLFSESLADNVRFGAPTASMDAVREAVRIANLEGELDRLPDGLATMVGERGVNLSGGQRQRASIARIALLEPKVLLLDDTLSAVDPPTAEAILRGLEPIMANRTTILVAHRLRTVQHADTILVLEDGRVTARGTHDQLMRDSEFYASVYSRQSEREDLSRELGIEGES